MSEAGSMEAGGVDDSMQHEMNCPAWKDMHGYECGESCTCGLKWRVALATEQAMHAAWRKRAEEAEAKLSTPPSPDKWDALRKAAEAALDPYLLVDSSSRPMQVGAEYYKLAQPTAILELLSELRGMPRQPDSQDIWEECCQEGCTRPAVKRYCIQHQYPKPVRGMERGGEGDGIEIRWNEMAQSFFVDFGPRVRFTATRKAAIQLSDALRAATRKERD